MTAEELFTEARHAIQALIYTLLDTPEAKRGPAWQKARERLIIAMDALKAAKAAVEAL